MVFGILPASQRERFEEESELDTSTRSPASVASVSTSRCNAGLLLRRSVRSPHHARIRNFGIPERQSFTDLRRDSCW